MKLEYVIMGYIILVVGRFYLRAIRDELREFRKSLNRHDTQTKGDVFFHHSYLPNKYRQCLNRTYRAGTTFAQLTTRPPEVLLSVAASLARQKQGTP